MERKGGCQLNIRNKFLLRGTPGGGWKAHCFGCVMEGQDGDLGQAGKAPEKWRAPEDQQLDLPGGEAG